MTDPVIHLGGPDTAWNPRCDPTARGAVTYQESRANCRWCRPRRRQARVVRRDTAIWTAAASFDGWFTIQDVAARAGGGPYGGTFYQPTARILLAAHREGMLARDESRLPVLYHWLDE